MVKAQIPTLATGSGDGTGSKPMSCEKPSPPPQQNALTQLRYSFMATAQNIKFMTTGKTHNNEDQLDRIHSYYLLCHVPMGTLAQGRNRFRKMWNENWASASSRTLCKKLNLAFTFLTIVKGYLNSNRPWWFPSYPTLVSYVFICDIQMLWRTLMNCDGP